MKTFPPTVIVMEPKPRWTPELQRQFRGESVRVRQCTTYAGLRQLAGECSVVVLDFDAAPAEALQFLGRHVGRRSIVRTVAIASPRTAELEWTVRNLGSLDFLVEPPSGLRLARLCRRQWTLDGSEAPLSLPSTEN